MPIETYCPNGHHLKTDEANAGKTGKCPVCKADVIISQPPVPPPKMSGNDKPPVSESAVVRILGDLNVGDSRVGKTVMASRRPEPAAVPHLKTCPNCDRDIDPGYQICPHCQKQLAGLNEF
ncbi:MAG: hypothetical protein LBT46_09090 [Planctomycetaceae bacterium]|jgi:hypothetical protein|nr:hypothetical protein [Planctomycetaceae bacterium]